MSNNQKRRLFVAAKDLERVLTNSDNSRQGLLLALTTLRVEMESARKAILGNQFDLLRQQNGPVAG